MTARGNIAAISIIIIALAAVAGVLIFLQKEKTPQLPSQTKSQEQQQTQEPDFAETLSWGGTCFTKPFEDQTADVIPKADFADADIEKIAIATKDNNLVIHVALKGEAKADHSRVIKVMTDRYFGNEFIQAYLDSEWEPAQNQWTLHYTPKIDPGKYFGTPQKIEPAKVEAQGHSIRLWYPLDTLIAGGRLETKDGNLAISDIEFTLYVIDKSDGTLYKDYLDDTKAQSGFDCPV